MRIEPGHPSRAGAVVARALEAVGHAAGHAGWVVSGYAQADRFGARGRNFVFDPAGTYTHRTIFVGNNVNLGVRPTLMATRAEIHIGNNVVFGPGVTVRGGNHRFDVVGEFIVNVDDSMKRDSDDRGVRIEDDVWVGGGATILHGVVISRGCVVGAGAVVSRSVPPYSVVAGNPARPVRGRFTLTQALAHERALYPLAQRLGAHDLAHLAD
ncbi:acyltransferase [Cryobacterium roopkundense]|uniref:Acetyltransferase-like isoleucine patch superfamily enzyme n=1 Tax=Cryobacterium roopkundense TaxID=1001240 RepID=A0A7W8ZYP1_9MICO|nr:acyltransferase [Cryobacterium roopkundense]MBB5642360.1 acetyltransferase-like isoleucine patch superfamily enzyme [Cryobacterium roopkundense]